MYFKTVSRDVFEAWPFYESARVTQSIDDIIEWNRIYRSDGRGDDARIYALDEFPYCEATIDSNRNFEYSHSADSCDGDFVPLDGKSGQYGYSGPVMHPSELLAGGPEWWLCNTPCEFFISEVYPLCECECECEGDCCCYCGNCDICDCDCFEPCGWVIFVHKIEGDAE